MSLLKSILYIILEITGHYKRNDLGSLFVYLQVDLIERSVP
jgi:hypothetical protein